MYIRLALIATAIALFFLIQVSLPQMPAESRVRRASPGASRGARRPSNHRAARAHPPRPVVRYQKDASVAEVAEKWLTRPELQSSQVGVEVMDLATGNVLFSAGGSRRFVPASTAKLLTTACAYDLLGPAYRYRTVITADGDINGDKLTGDIEFVPVQDPSFSRADLSKIFSTAASRVRHVDGAIRIFTPPGGGDHFVPGWLVEDWGQDWMPISSDLVIDHNVYTGGSLPHGVKLIEEPSHSELMAHNRSLMRVDLSPGWMIYEPKTGLVKSFRGYPTASGKGPLVVGNPTAFNSALVASAALDAGIKFRKRAQDDVRSTSTHILAEHLSEPITEILEECLHESDNLYAQQLLRSIGLQESLSEKDAKLVQSGGTITLEDRGMARMVKWLASIGVDPRDVVLKDGCGLSRKDCVTPHSLNMTLKHMASKYGEGYLSLLKGGEVTGAGKGYWRFKTGAMDSVRTITGVLKTSSGRNLALTIMVNGHQPSVSNVRTSMNALISGLVGTAHSVTPPPEKTP